jgi:hypothetical protein
MIDLMQLIGTNNKLKCVKVLSISNITGMFFITVEKMQQKMLRNTTHLKSFMLYEIALNKFFCSPLKRLILSSVHAMTQSKKAKQYDTKNGARKGLILNYDDLIEQGWNKNAIKESLKELVNNGYIEKIAIRGNRQLMCIKEKAIKILKNFSDMFSRDEQELNNTNFGSQIINEPEVKKSSNPYKVKKEKLKENILKNNEYQNNHETKLKDEKDCFDCFSLDSELYSYDPGLDLNKQTIDDEISDCSDLYAYDSVENQYTGTHEDFLDTLNLGDELTPKQENAIEYYAKLNNFDACELYHFVLELKLKKNYSSFHVLLGSAIDALEAIEKENASDITINEKDITSKAKKPSKIDYYGIQHAEIKRDGKLTEKQEHAIHSLLDFLQRKSKITFDYTKYFKWLILLLILYGVIFSVLLV